MTSELLSSYRYFLGKIFGTKLLNKYITRRVFPDIGHSQCEKNLKFSGSAHFCGKTRNSAAQLKILKTALYCGS